MQAQIIRKTEKYYRCMARSLAPGSAVLGAHPTSVYLSEASVLESLNKWLCQVFDRGNLDRTVAALVASQGSKAQQQNVDMARKRLASAEAKLRRFQAAIAAGVEPAALVEAINEAEQIRAAADAELKGSVRPTWSRKRKLKRGWTRSTM